MSSDDVSRIEMLLREHFAQTDKQIAEMKAENAEFHARMIKDFDEFKSEVRKDIKDFKSEVRQDIKEFKSEVKQEIDNLRSEVRHDIRELKAEVVELQKDVTGLKHDVQGIYHWDYWLLSIILVIFAMPQIVAGVKSLFGAIVDGISAIAVLFRKDNKVLSISSPSAILTPLRIQIILQVQVNEVNVKIIHGNFP